MNLPPPRTPPAPSRLTPGGIALLYAVIVFLLAAAVASRLIWDAEQRRLLEQRARVATLAGYHAYALQSTIERALSAAYALAALVRYRNGAVGNFDIVAGQMLPFYPGAASLQLAPGGVVQHVVPLAGNEQAIGHDLLQDRARAQEAFLARDTGKLTLAGPFNLIQGGLGAVGLLPVFLDQPNGNPSFWGFASVVIRFPEALEPARLPQLAERGFAYELWRIHPDTGQKQVIAASSSVTLIEPVERTLDVANATWTLSAAPAKGWGDPLGFSLKAVLGLLCSLALGGLAKLLAELRANKKGLEALVARRTAELAAREADLNRAQSIARVGSWVLDVIGNEQHWTSSAETYRILGLPEGAPLDYENFLRQVHPDDRDAVDHAWQAVLKGTGYDMECRIVVGAAVRWVRGLAEPVFDANGMRRCVGTIQDITERKLAEQDLRIAATTFEAQEGVVITDTENAILRVNRAFTDITGYTAEEAVGQNVRLLKSGRHGAAFYAAMWERIQRTGRWQGEIWNRRKNGEVYPEWLTITAVKGDAGGVTHYVGTLADITQRKAAESEIEYLAFYDPLTRLPNRRLLLDRLQQALAASARSQHLGALLFIDLDHFKTLNDTLGHDKGDLLLQQIAQRLTTCVREGDTVARQGGDEFVVVLEGLSESSQEAAAQAKTIGEKILATLNHTYLLAGYEYHSTLSIGITLFNAHQDTVDELLKQADISMYQAKAAGRNALRFFDPDMQAAVAARATLEADLRQGLPRNQFLLYYQPQVDGEGHPTGAEALVRWQHPQRGLISPAEFIPLAEETGLILPLGGWVLETACARLVAWAARPETAGLSLAVNVSVRQFGHPDFVEQVLAALDHTGANPRKLKLELTETMLVADVEDTIAKMTALKAQGVGFSLDDFGTGYSSLSYLKRLPLDQLKIDRSFVRDVLTDPNDATIVRAILALGQSLGLAVIAEGVETEAQRDFLARHGCDAYQGYLFSRLLSAEQFEAFMLGKTPA